MTTFKACRGTIEILPCWPGRARPRLRLGQVLEVVGRRQHCCTLGFSSISAYALERCERSGRWVEGARCLARRLEALAAAAGCRALEGATASELDREVRGVAQLLARHELDLSLALLAFHRADGWRQLGYATESQYALERLGMSRSSMVARRALAVRLESLPGSVCTWCHLFGIHGGRIRAEGTADGIHWELGPREQPCVVVHGRERQAA